MKNELPKIRLEFDIGTRLLLGLNDSGACYYHFWLYRDVVRRYCCEFYFLSIIACTVYDDGKGISMKR